MPLFAPSLPTTLLGLLLLASGADAVAQEAGKAGGIYTCTDSRGRRLTSDRPIPECLDREQRELSGSGTVKRVVPPSYTADERARMAAEKKAAEALLARSADEKRRDRALLVRYPNPALHDKERKEVLNQVDEVINAVNKRSEVLVQQRKEVATELEFYQNDVNKAPAWLKRKVADVDQQEQELKKFVGEQLQEKARINARFDEELSRLKQLWSSR